LLKLTYDLETTYGLVSHVSHLSKPIRARLGNVEGLENSVGYCLPDT
jgi:hypothetical protein